MRQNLDSLDHPHVAISVVLHMVAAAAVVAVMVVAMAQALLVVLVSSTSQTFVILHTLQLIED